MKMQYSKEYSIVTIKKSKDERETNFSFLNKTESDEVIKYVNDGIYDDLRNEIIPFMNQIASRYKEDFRFGFVCPKTENHIDESNYFKRSMIPGVIFCKEEDEEALANSVNELDPLRRTILFNIPEPNKDCVFPFRSGDVVLTKQLETKPGMYFSSSKRGRSAQCFLGNIKLYFNEWNSNIVEISSVRYDAGILLFRLLERLHPEEQESIIKVIRSIYQDESYTIERCITGQSDVVQLASEEYNKVLDRIINRPFDSRTLKYIVNGDFLIGKTLGQNFCSLEEGTLIDNINCSHITSSGTYCVYADKVNPQYYIYTPIQVNKRSLITATRSFMNKYVQMNDDGTAILNPNSDFIPLVDVIDILKRDGQNTILVGKDNKGFEYNLQTTVTQMYVNDVTDDVTLMAIFQTGMLFSKLQGFEDYLPDVDDSFNKIAITPKMHIQRAFIRAAKEKIANCKDCIKNIVDNPDTLNSIEAKYGPKTTMPYLFDQIIASMISIMRRDFKVVTKLSPNSLINLVSYKAELAKIVTFHKDKNSIADSQRRINNLMLNKIDFIEVPVGHEIGVNNYVASGCKIQPDGTLKVDYFKVRNGIVTDEVYALDSIEESEHILGQYSDLELDENGKILNKVMCRVPSPKRKFELEMKYVEPEEVEFVTTSMDSALSYTTATIPFLSSNDTARSTFADTQTKQGKSIIAPEIPYVMTNAYQGIETEQFHKHKVVAADCKKAKENVNYTNSDNSVILYKKLYDYEQAQENDELDKVKDENLIKTNIFTGDIHTVGVNALVAYIPNGYNYEDGVYISERLSSKLSSFRMKTFQREIVQSSNNVIITDFSTKLPHEIYASLISKSNDKTNLILDDLQPGILINSYTGKSQKTKGSTLYNDFLFISSLESGDKITNRHGNKGVKAFEGELAVAKNSRMPLTNNGEFIDIVYNPLGVVTRMNYGQIKELRLGLVAYILNVRFKFSASLRIPMDFIMNLVKMVYELTQADNFDLVLSKYDIDDEFKQHIKDRESYIKSWKDCLNPDGTANLKDPETGVEIKNVNIGINYIYKMVQESIVKAVARGGVFNNNNYNHSTESPSKGNNKPGGQRIGTMELDALMAYNAYGLIDECLNIKGDNPEARNNYYFETVGAKAPNNKNIRRSVLNLMSYYAAMGISVETDSDIGTVSLNPSQYRKFNKREFMYKHERSSYKGKTSSKSQMLYFKVLIHLLLMRDPDKYMSYIEQINFENHTLSSLSDLYKSLYKYYYPEATEQDYFKTKEVVSAITVTNPLLSAYNNDLALFLNNELKIQMTDAKSILMDLTAGHNKTKKLLGGITNGENSI